MEKLNTSEIEKHLSNIEGWEYDGNTIWKKYTFDNFKEAFSIMTRIAFECEQINHHPYWENVYNSLTVRLNTHDVNGITQKDFDLARKIEQIVGNA